MPVDASLRFVLAGPTCDVSRQRTKKRPARARARSFAPALRRRRRFDRSDRRFHLALPQRRLHEHRSCSLAWARACLVSWQEYTIGSRLLPRRHHRSTTNAPAKQHGAHNHDDPTLHVTLERTFASVESPPPQDRRRRRRRRWLRAIVGVTMTNTRNTQHTTVRWSSRSAFFSLSARESAGMPPLAAHTIAHRLNQRRGDDHRWMMDPPTPFADAHRPGFQPSTDVKEQSSTSSQHQISTHCKALIA
uniref:Uncharacterized protein n=1 Tax=Plectus sambesii TaxID=2011161 RepID=A0A914VM80_9BILA